MKDNGKPYTLLKDPKFAYADRYACMFSMCVHNCSSHYTYLHIRVHNCKVKGSRVAKGSNTKHCPCNSNQMYIYIRNLSLFLYKKRVICHSSLYFIHKSRPRREGLYVNRMVLDDSKELMLPPPFYFSLDMVIPE